MRKCLGLTALLFWSFVAGASDKTDQAVATGSTWLRQLDRQQYSEAYGAMSAATRGKVGYDAWLTSMQLTRVPLGEVRKRELVYGALEKEMPGLPRGDYARLRFRSDFARQYQLLEQVSLILEPDGQWRVLGYAVQPDEKPGEKK